MVHLEHTKAFASGITRVGNATDNITVDTDNHTVKVMINGAVVHEWS